MKVVGIAGSLRPKSNTLHYVTKTLDTLAEKGLETELISLRGKKVEPCNGCYDCVKKARCTIKGDDFDEILAKMREAEGIVLGSPVYLSSVVPQMMALLARATLWPTGTINFSAARLAVPLRWRGGPDIMWRFPSFCSGFSSTA